MKIVQLKESFKNELLLLQVSEISTVRINASSIELLNYFVSTQCCIIHLYRSRNSNLRFYLHKHEPNPKQSLLTHDLVLFKPFFHHI